MTRASDALAVTFDVVINIPLHSIVDSGVGRAAELSKNRRHDSTLNNMELLYGKTKKSLAALVEKISISALVGHKDRSWNLLLNALTLIFDKLVKLDEQFPQQPTETYELKNA
jgi:hypothetical protein